MFFFVVVVVVDLSARSKIICNARYRAAQFTRVTLTRSNTHFIKKVSKKIASHLTTNVYKVLPSIHNDHLPKQPYSEEMKELLYIIETSADDHLPGKS